MAITHGDATDHRPDLQPAVIALMVAQDGGVPVMRQRWDGNASDTPMFQERAPALLATFRASPHPRDLVADAKLYTEDHAPHLAQLGLITRLPGPRKLVTQVITQALHWDTWPYLQARTRDQGLEWCHDRRAQRWLVVCSQAALERAEARLNHACQREAAAITQPLLHRHAQRFATPTQAQEAWSGVARNWRDHPVASDALLDHLRDGQKGRPTAATPIHALAWQMHAQVRLEATRIEDATPQTACFVLGTNIETEQLSDAEVIAGDNAPSQAEGGFRCLKDPLFLVASWFVKKPRRSQGLLLVMTLARLVYAVAQRRLRRA
jgi:transposase